MLDSDYLEFFGRKFLINTAVLRPRPETEKIIELVKLHWSQLPNQIIDIGTGSGIIAITLALEFPQAEITAIDISSKALEVAKNNQMMHKSQVDFFQSNLLKNLPLDNSPKLFIANLPYVGLEYRNLVLPNLKNFSEPELAIFTNQGGLKLVIELLEELQKYQQIQSGGALILESERWQQPIIEKLAKSFKLRFWQRSELISVFRF